MLHNPKLYVLPVHYTPINKITPALLAGVYRIELQSIGLESSVLPLHQAPMCGVIRLLLVTTTPGLHIVSIISSSPIF